MDRFLKIAKELENSEADALLITGQSNRFYAAGFPSSDGAAVVTREKAYFFTDSRYIEAASDAIKNAEVREVTGAAGYLEMINGVIREHDIKTVGFEENALSYKEYTAYRDGLGARLIPAEAVLTRLRASKDETELAVMRQAQRIAEQAFTELLGVISTDMTEKELAAELLYRMQKLGADDKSFDTIAVSGEKSSMPHGVPGDVKLKKGFLTIDFGARYQGYCSDTTRTLCIGEPTEEMRLVYDTVLRAQETGIAAARAGIGGAALDAAARRVIDDAGFGQYFGHSFSHGIGIDIHEAPTSSKKSKDIIPAGAVISAEPGIYLPGKFGVRIEDALIITADGCEDITHLPKNLIIL